MMGFGLFGLLFMFLFWGGLVALAVWLVRQLFPGQDRPPVAAGSEGASARQILDRRYAHGEISRDQYELMKQDLG